MRSPVAVLALVLLAGSGAPLDAQEWQVARQSFAFAGSRLTIHVDAEAAGTLRVIRGAPGSVAVASRAARGFTAAGLSDREELTLTAAGPGPVDYMVSVPGDVWIQVLLPGRTFSEAIAGHDRSRTFEWDRTGARDPAPLPEWVPPAATGGPALFTTFAADATPRTVSLPELSTVHSLGVRFEGSRFRVLTGRPLTVTEGAEDRLEIHLGAPPMDLVLVLPADTRDFRLVAGELTALAVIDGEIRTLCSPVIDQRLSDGRRWLTFQPEAGTLHCTDPPTPRHEG